MTEPIADYERFVRQVAALTTDDEMKVQMGGSETDPGTVMEYDDMWETLHALIGQARHLLRNPDTDEVHEGENADREYDEERREHEDGANCCECGSEDHKCHDCPTFMDAQIDRSEDEK